MYTFTTRQTRGKGFFFSNERTRRRSSEGEFSCERNNHLGNVLAVISDKVNLYGHNNAIDSARATVVSASDYYPFGLTMKGRDYSSSTYRFGYQSYERDDEIKGKGNHLSFGDYGYDPKIGIRWNVDPLAQKYSSLSPYVFCYDNPINVVDPDGREGIVVSGQPGDHNNKQHFLVNGLSRASAMASQYKKDKNGETATWIIYNGGGKGGYDAKTIEKYQKLAGKAGVSVIVVSDAREIVDYVNEKTGNGSRGKDLISKFSYSGHATPGDLDVGFVNHNVLNKITNDKVEPSDFSGDAFKSGCSINVVGGCNTAKEGELPTEKSVIEQFSGKVDSKSTIKGSNVSVGYLGGVRTDEQLVKYKGTNGIQVNGSVIEIKGKKKDK